MFLHRKNVWIFLSVIASKKMIQHCTMYMEPRCSNKRKKTSRLDYVKSNNILLGFISFRGRAWVFVYTTSIQWLRALLLKLKYFIQKIVYSTSSVISILCNKDYNCGYFVTKYGPRAQGFFYPAKLQKISNCNLFVAYDILYCERFNFDSSTLDCRGI